MTKTQIAALLVVPLMLSACVHNTYRVRSDHFKRAQKLTEEGVRYIAIPAKSDRGYDKNVRLDAITQFAWLDKGTVVVTTEDYALPRFVSGIGLMGLGKALMLGIAIFSCSEPGASGCIDDTTPWWIAGGSSVGLGVAVLLWGLLTERDTADLANPERW